MKGENRAIILAVAAAVTMAACASKGPVSSTRSAPADPQAELAAQYQQLIDNALNPVVCREQDVTGSRIHKREVCVRLADIEADREQALRLVHEIRERATLPQPMAERSMGSTPSRP